MLGTQSIVCSLALRHQLVAFNTRLCAKKEAASEEGGSPGKTVHNHIVQPGPCKNSKCFLYQSNFLRFVSLLLAEKEVRYARMAMVC